MERVLHVVIQGYKRFRKASPQSCHLTHPAELSKDLFASVGRAFRVGQIPCATVVCLSWLWENMGAGLAQAERAKKRCRERSWRAGKDWFL